MRDLDAELEDILRTLLDKLLDYFEEKHVVYEPTDNSNEGSLWDILWLDGQFDLIKKLRHVELEEHGFKSIIVPPEGFSDNDRVHNLVLRWLQQHCVNIVNVGLIEARRPHFARLAITDDKLMRFAATVMQRAIARTERGRFCSCGVARSALGELFGSFPNCSVRCVLLLPRCAQVNS